jgi:endo-1,4-beta-mannosidase
MPRTYEDSGLWNAMHARTIRRYSDLPVSAGMHLPAIISNNGFRPDFMAPNNDFLSMHAYSVYFGPTQDDDPLNSDVVPMASLVTEALGGKSVLLEEFGYASSERGDISEYKTVRRGDVQGRQYFADDQSGGRYYREVLEKLARVGSLGAFGWMFSDYDPLLWDRPPYDTHEHERFFGLTRYDGTVKPSGEAMRDFAQRVASGECPVRSVPPLQLDPDEWYGDPAGNFTRMFELWRGRI